MGRSRIAVRLRGRVASRPATQNQLPGRTIWQISYHHNVVRRAVQQRCQHIARRPRPKAAKDAFVAAQPVQTHARGG